MHAQKQYIEMSPEIYAAECRKV